MLQAAVFEKVCFFIQGCKQMQIVRGIENRTGVRPESEYSGFQIPLFCYAVQTADDTLVSQMNPVKHTNG